MSRKKLAFQKASDIDYNTVRLCCPGREIILSVAKPERMMVGFVKARSERFAARRSKL